MWALGRAALARICHPGDGRTVVAAGRTGGWIQKLGLWNRRRRRRERPASCVGRMRALATVHSFFRPSSEQVQYAAGPDAR